MSIWSDMATIVGSTLGGDITFQDRTGLSLGSSMVRLWTFDAARCDCVLLSANALQSVWKNALGYSATKITHPIISVLLLLGMLAAFLPPMNDLLNTITLGYLAVLVVFGPIILIMFERTPERTIVIYCYIIMASIIFIGVIQRFVFSVQVPWSTTIPPLLVHDHGVVRRDV